MSISVGSVSVEVVPDVSGFAEKMKAKLKGVTAQIIVDANLDRLRADLEEATRPRSATINVNADTSAAEARIDAAARDRTANIRTDSSGFSGAAAGVSGLGLAVAGLGPVLIPITAAIAGLAAVLVAPLAAAGGGLTIGGLIAGKAIKDTNEQKKNIDELAKKVVAARKTLANTLQSVSGSSAISDAAARRAAERQIASAKTPAAAAKIRATLADHLSTSQARGNLRVATAQQKVTEATAAYDAALKGLTPTQKRFLASQQALKDSFKRLTKVAGPAIFGPVIKGMDLLAAVLPKLAPLIKGVAGGIETLLGDLGAAASGPGFKAFLRSFGTEAGSAIVSFGRIFGNVTKGFFGIFRAFGPLSKGFVGGLSDSAAAFANFGLKLRNSKSFQSFLSYLRDVGPKVASALGHMVVALGKIATVLAPLGGLVLGLVDGISKLIIAADPKVLAGIALGIGLIGETVFFATPGISGLVVAIAGLGVGLAYAYTHSTKFRGAVDGLVDGFKKNLLPALKDAGEKVLPAIRDAFNSVKDSIQKNRGLFAVIGGVLHEVGKVIVDKVIPAVATFYSIYIPLLGKAIGGAITVVALLGRAFLDMAKFGLIAFKFLVGAALASFGAILTAADKGLGWIKGIGDDIHNAKRSFDNFRDNTVAALDASIGKVQDLQDVLNNVKPPKPVVISVKTKFPKGQLPILQQMLTAFPQPEGAGATGAIVNRPTVALIGERGPEVLTPLNQTPGNSPLPGGGVGGPQFVIEKVVAQDVNDFLRQAQLRSRHAALDGIRRAG